MFTKYILECIGITRIFKKKKEIGADNKHRKYRLEMKKKKEKTPTKSNNKN
jgi:hypothetical protein